MTALPPFPVDPGTLDAIEEALRYSVSDERAAATATTDDITEAEIAGHALTLDDVLQQAADRHVDLTNVDRERPVVDVPPLYSRDVVILALITEVRRLRELAERLLPRARA
ncbi:hypothetical protein FK268_12720 [Tsukamurella sputi]|uniref:Uncharacterized protein n=1 Tax=Tsukamurella sputi TaxID=2591848 RepID=A0A5C5RJR3_9ACTN|nr:hypothetical protein [Tsukamurella sputi]TWS23177.1 hypothetical protein FK268_12720 [Tsukamurella sputi]